ncbi:MAG TPA: ABC transporter permease [Streptosporangiaceae bacterium]|jgi:ABC-2 type transport system permease protein|nr:ABC transporter permease [Streptosporangiaceae bacterium]
MPRELTSGRLVLRRAHPGAVSARRPGRLAAEVSALLIIAQRDVIKLIRDRPRLAVNLAFPVLLIAGLGGLLQSTVGRVTGLSTITLAFTGVLAASLFQSSAAGMISIVEDRENDFSRELFIAPVSRLTLLAGKITGESAVAVGQGICIVAFALAFGVRMTGWQLLGLAGTGLTCCLLGAAFGLATIAALPNQRSAMQIFQFLIIPQYVLGGVLVPLAGAPRLLGALAWLMPMRYGVDLTRAAFYAGTSGYQKVVIGGPAVDLAVIAALTAALLAAGAALFSYRERVR